MKTLKNNFLLLLTVIVLNPVLTAYSDDYHYINNNIGNRATGLGGAYTAISDDTAGCYYNPAGIAFASSNKMSASVNTIQTSTKEYKGVLQGTDGSRKSWEQESFNLLPNFFGIVQKFGPGMMGLSYAVPEAIERRQKQTFTNIQGASAIDMVSINTNDNDKSYFMGPSYALKINDSLAIGTTLYYYYRDTELITNYYFDFASGDTRIFNRYSTKKSHGFKPNIGVIWEPVENIALGLSMSKLWITSTDLEIQTINNDNIDPSILTLDQFESSHKDDQPLSTNLGLAWFYSPSLLFSLDLKYVEEVYDKQYVLNGSFGTEYYLNDFIALRGGFYTDLANTPDLTKGVANTYNEHLDIYGTNVSCTFFSGQTSLTLGLAYSFGSGDSQIVSGNTDIYDVDYENISFQIATSFSY